MFLWCWYPPTSSRHNPEDQQWHAQKWIAKWTVG
jgi:hypothetical protein